MKVSRTCTIRQLCRVNLQVTFKWALRNSRPLTKPFQHSLGLDCPGQGISAFLLVGKRVNGNYRFRQPTCNDLTRN